MILRALNRIRRSPVPVLAMLLFTSILSLVLCGLEASTNQELEDYQQIYRTTPVTFTVTNLTGTQSDNLKLPAWAADVFVGDALLPYSLRGYVKNVHIQAEYRMNPEKETLRVDGTLVDTTNISICGITSEDQIIGNGITWLNTPEEDVLLSAERICIIPESMVTSEKLPKTLSFLFLYQDIGLNGEIVTHQYRLELEVVGTHQANNETVYCPYSVIRGIYVQLDRKTEVDFITAVLTDNDLLDEAREEARYWFPEPDLSGTKIPWKFGSYTYYPYALRIDDSQLRSLEETLRNSLTINKICTTLVFVLSAGAGFFAGFLVVRSRKKEIALMRTMGTSNSSIFVCIVFEQMLCVVLGTLLGGSYFLFQPVVRLAAFVGIYFVGLSIALLVFLYTNLLTTIKEDE